MLIKMTVIIIVAVSVTAGFIFGRKSSKLIEWYEGAL